MLIVKGLEKRNSFLLGFTQKKERQRGETVWPALSVEIVPPKQTCRLYKVRSENAIINLLSDVGHYFSLVREHTDFILHQISMFGFW